MPCFFCGGPLDGELREVRNLSLESSHELAWSHGRVFKGHTYFIANGIARHESVSEEEVARRVATCYRGQSLQSIKANLERYSIGRMPTDDELGDFIQRYMRPQLPTE